MTTQYIFVAEITMAVDAAGTLQTHLACTGEGFATRPGDTPAHTAVPPTLLDPGSLRREMFSGDKPFGAVRPAFGEVVLFNGDGRYDAWEHHGFDGRPFVLRWGPLGGAYPGDFTTVVVCTVEGITLTETEARLRLRDHTQLLDKPFLKDAFTGDTVPEGSGVALKGQVKHRYIGAPRWTGPAPQIVSEVFGSTIYHLSTGQHSSSRVWDNGNELTQETAGADFWAATPSPTPGKYWVHTQAGNIFLRLGSRAEGDLRVFLTANQSGGAAWAMQDFLQEAGYSGPVVGTSLPGIRGVFADAGITYARIFDDAAANAGMWWGFDRLGRFVSKVFDAPTGPPVLTLSRGNCTSVKRSPVPGMEVPLHQLSVNSIQTWRSNYTSPVNYVRQKFEAEQWVWRFSHADASVLVKHKAARSLHMDLLIGPDSGSDFDALRNRYLAMFGVDRSLVTATVPLSQEALALDLGDAVRVQWPRFNLAEGRLFRVVSVRYALRERQIEFALWG